MKLPEGVFQLYGKYYNQEEEAELAIAADRAQKDIDDEKTCRICLDGFEKPGRIYNHTIGKIDHSYHYDCMLKWAVVCIKNNPNTPNPITCPLCTEALKINDEIVTHKEQHFYHYTCMESWGEACFNGYREITCPLCRLPLAGSE